MNSHLINTGLRLWIRPWLAASAAWLFASAAHSGDEDCTARVAARATVSEIATNPTAFSGRCVAVDGVMHHRSLFESVDGVYLQPTNRLNPSSSGARLGLDGLGKHYAEGFQHVSIIGRVQDCEEVRECVQASAAPGEVVMIMGYCHHWNGAYLYIERLTKRGGPPFERQMGSAARAGYGDLEPAPADWKHRATVDALADEYVEAVRTADRERLLALHFRNAELNWKDDEAELIRFMLKDRRSPFLAIRKRPEVPQREIFIKRSSLASREEDYTATVCFCREDDCTGRWPIAHFDTDNLRTRPYVCTTVAPYVLYGKREAVPHFTTDLGKAGLAEPGR